MGIIWEIALIKIFRFADRLMLMRNNVVELLTFLYQSVLVMSHTALRSLVNLSFVWGIEKLEIWMAVLFGMYSIWIPRSLILKKEVYIGLGNTDWLPRGFLELLTRELHQVLNVDSNETYVIDFVRMQAYSQRVFLSEMSGTFFDIHISHMDIIVQSSHRKKYK